MSGSAVTPGPTLEIRDYLEVIRRRKLLIAAAVVISVLTTLLWSSRQSRTYVASATVLVGAGASERGERGERVDLNTERQVVRSQGVIKLAGERLGPGHSPGELRSKVSAKVLADTRVLVVTFSAPNPTAAVAGANAFADAYVEHRGRKAENMLQARIQAIRSRIDALEPRLREADAVLAATQPPEGTPPSPDHVAAKTRRRLLLDEISELNEEQARLSGVGTGGNEVLMAATTATTVQPAADSPASPMLATLVGLLIGLPLAFVRDRMDGRVRGAEDVERCVGAPVLAAVPVRFEPRYRRAGAVSVVGEPDGAASDAYGSVALAIVAMAPPGVGGTFMITSCRRNDGKTAVTANLAASIARLGHRVVVVCRDVPSEDFAGYFRLSCPANHPRLHDVLAGRASAQDVIHQTAVEGLSLACCHENWTMADARVLQEPVARQFLDSLRGVADYVVIDAPPTPSIATLALSILVDGMLLVARVGATRREELVALRRQLDLLDAPIVGALVVGSSRVPLPPLAGGA